MLRRKAPTGIVRKQQNNGAIIFFGLKFFRNRNSTVVPVARPVNAQTAAAEDMGIKRGNSPIIISADPNPVHPCSKHPRKLISATRIQENEKLMILFAR